MPGVKGQIRSTPRPGTLRCKAWQSMRILRRFNTADLCRTTGGMRNNVRKFVRRLAAHGYVEPFGDYVSGRTGQFQAYRLLRDVGPDYPTICDRCGRPLGSPCLGEENDQ